MIQQQEVAVAEEAPEPEAETDHDAFVFVGFPMLPTGVVVYDSKTMKKAKQIEAETRLTESDEMEDLIIKAAKHIHTAKEMCEFANEKIRKSVESHCKSAAEKDAPTYEYVDTIICDFCQNLGLPQLGEHQAGATYYYSPLTIYCFGITNVYLEQPKLQAYIYHEGEGKKGGNNVASMIMKHIRDMGWATTDDGAKQRTELNIIMDNCAGQNKNRMVLRLSPLLVELQWYARVNMIFLVAGHTKNAADRLFNLLQREYQKSNIYNLEQLIQKLNNHPLIDAVKVNEDVFIDWDAFLGKIYTGIPGGLVSQYQYFFSFAWQPGWLFAQLSSALTAEGVKVDLRNTKMAQDDRMKMLSPGQSFDTSQIAMLKPPGVRAIKQVEMYEKWHKFVPEEHITDLYKKPEVSTVAELKQQQKRKKELLINNKQEEDDNITVVAAATAVVAIKNTTKKARAANKKAPAKRKVLVKNKATSKRQPATKQTTKMTRGKKKG
jgi:hypothetical protein